MGPIVLIFDPKTTRARSSIKSWQGQGMVTIHLARLDELGDALRPDACAVPDDLDPRTERALRRLLGPDIPVSDDAAVLRRALVDAQWSSELIDLGDRTIDLRQRRVFHRDRIVNLTEREASLLWWLALHPGEVVSREALLVHVWGHQPTMATRTVDNTLGRLRKKLEDDPAHPQHLVTVWGEGYRFLSKAHHRPPKPPPELLGRSTDLSTLHRAVTRHRTVTVLGPAGVGKTALVRAFCKDRQDAVFVDLSAAHHPEDVDAAVAVATHLGRGPIAEGLRNLGPCLWVLDNVEQLVSWLPHHLTPWLDANPSLRLVSTSRAVVGLDEEHVQMLDSLPLDAALVLLRRVGQARRPSFATGEDSDAHLRQLATALDRLPLALELAASRARIMSSHDLLRRVRHDLDVVREVASDGEPRTLQGAVAQSWALLGVEEQAALAALSSFRGGFDLDAAEAVAACDPTLIERLVDQSMVKVAAPEEGVRFYLLDTIRRFAAEQLSERGEQSAVLRAHAVWFESQDPWRREPDSNDPWSGLAALKANHENVYVAARRHYDTDPTLAGRLALQLCALWEVDFVSERDVGLLEEIAPRVQGRDGLSTTLWYRIADATLSVGDVATATEAAERCASAARAAGDGDSVAQSDLITGHLHAQRGEPRLARAAFERAIRSARDPRVRIEGHFSLGTLASREGVHDEAEHHVEAALVLSRVAGAPGKALDSHGLLGAIHYRAGRIDDALRETRAAAEGWRTWNSPLRVAWLTTNLGVLHLRLDQPRAALDVLARSTDRFAALGSLPDLAQTRIHLARAHLANDDAEAALAEAREAVRLALQLERRAVEARARIEVVFSLQALGRLEPAHAEADRVLGLANALGDASTTMHALWVRGQLKEAAGELQRAFDDYQAALDARTEAPTEGTTALYASLASVRFELGDPDAARRWLARARAGPPPVSTQGRRALDSALSKLRRSSF